ncbi:hypothetical protein [Photobacterium atrarenae]|uniref:Uncharacterized protein n=1 Tax=Photobacterium atrarenae TaxID=865757 RepID=A0ABY5GF84_9GAMM|nr:hypothetical protein [Photobacterium atrarenae]UTV27506.1 hypothetical protein NNL38_14515 [Photobacterium atrarenae]
MENEMELNEIELNEEVHTQEDEAALLQQLGDEQDFDPSTAGAKAADDAQALAAGAASVMAVLGISEQMLKQFGHKDFAFDPSQAENVANTAAPLFVKYGGEMPPWLAQYKEEFTFVVAAGALGFTSFMQLRMLKASDAAKEVAESETESEPSGETE